MLPADQVEAFASLIDEVERMSAVGESAVSRDREQKVGERSRRGAAGYGGEQSAFASLAMSYGAPVPEPTVERREIGPTRERRPLSTWRLAVAVGGDATRTIEQRQIDLFLRQHRQQVAERGQDGRADPP